MTTNTTTTTPPAVPAGGYKSSARRAATERTVARTRTRHALLALVQASDSLHQPDQLYRHLAAVCNAAEQALHCAVYLLKYEMPEQARELAKWNGGELYPLTR